MYFTDALSRAHTNDIRANNLFNATLTVAVIEIIPNLPKRITEERTNHPTPIERRAADILKPV